MYDDVKQMIHLIYDIEWYKDFQMRYNFFISLCTILEAYIMKVDTNFRKIIRVDKAVAMFLYKLAFGHNDRTIR
jgi:hypothetical protein